LIKCNTQDLSRGTKIKAVLPTRDATKIIAIRSDKAQPCKKKIEMTAPVTSTKVGGDKKYLISFTMPVKYTLESLPEPVNKSISIYKVEPHKSAVLKFSGYLNERTYAKKTGEL
jgi:hypothetical protein